MLSDFHKEVSQTKNIFNRKIILAFYAAVIFIITIRVWNKYVFQESSVFAWGFIFVVAGIIITRGRLPKNYYFLNITFFFMMFIFYVWLRLDNPLNIDFFLRISKGFSSGFMQFFYLIINFLLFVSAALIYSKKRRFPVFLWFIFCGLLIAHIIRIALNIQSVQQGSNLIPGFIFITLLPFVFFVPGTDRLQILPVLLCIICIFTLAFVGSRTGSITILVFMFLLYAWPWITKRKVRHYGVFFGLCILLFAFYHIYIKIGLMGTNISLMNDSMLQAFNKPLGTGRAEIWAELLKLISNNPVFGHGTDASTVLTSPPAHFVMSRHNLSAHSVFIEILYRLGVIGLLIFAFLILMIWRIFWFGRDEFVVRVAGSYLISILLFSSVSTYLIFTEMSLKSGITWITLGIGTGASLKQTAKIRTHVHNHFEQ